jgi:hypothetical protein
MVEGISQLNVWNSTSQKVVVACAVAAVAILISGIVLTALDSFGRDPLILFCSGGGLLAVSIIYSLVLCAKSSSQPEGSNVSSTNKGAQTVHVSSSSPKKISLGQLTDDEASTVIFNVLTETKQERQEAIELLAKLSEKSNEDRVRESLYRFADKPTVIKHLIDTLPRFNELLVSLDSGMVYDILTEYGKNLKNESKIIQVFQLLDDAHRCALLRAFIKDKNLFLALIEKAPAGTKKELRQSDLPETLHLANELLDAWFFKDVFFHVYEALSDQQQKTCLKRILEERNFHSKRFELITKTQAAIQHPIEFIEYTLGKKLKDYCGKINPCLPNDTTDFFDKILPTLPAHHIVTYFWRIAREKLKVWGRSHGWEPEFQGTPEEKEFFKSLSFDQVTRLNNTGQPWFAMWHPSEQSDESIVDLCFKQLNRAQEKITEYHDTQYDPVGKLFNNNWKNFLHLLSFQQVSMLICQDPHLQDLNQIFGFEQIFETVPEHLLEGIPNSKHSTYSKRISIPAILQHWWKMSRIEVSTEERIEAIKALKLEDKYTLYFIHMHEEHEKHKPFVEAMRRADEARMSEARAFTQEWRRTKITMAQFIYERQQAKLQAEQEQRRAQEALNNMLGQTLEIIRSSLRVLGMDSARQYSKPEIEKIVRKELFKYHPDRQRNKSSEEIQKSEEQFKKFSNARDELLQALEKRGSDRTPIC